MKMSPSQSWLYDLRCRLKIRQRLTYGYRRWRSLQSRPEAISHYLNGAGPKKLQIGTGDNYLAGWLNTDLVPKKDVAYLDATQRLPFPDSSFDYVFSEHMFEHISYRDGQNLLKEIHRILKPGGCVRIATPDIAFLVKLYAEPDTDLARRYIRFSVDKFVEEPKFYAPTVVLNTFFRSWGHQFIYDFDTLGHTLKTAGFKGTTRCQPGESADPNLKNLETHGQVIGEEFNLLETIVVEAEKKV